MVRTELRHEVQRKVLQCADCGINFLEPQERDLAGYYRHEYRTKHSPVVGKRLGSREMFDLNLPIQDARIDVVRDRLSPSMRVLDVGCATGHFLYKIKPLVEECVGIEFNEEHARFVNEELGFKVHTVPIDQTPVGEGYFDLITAFHMVEHVEDPVGLLTTLSRYLKSDGILYIEVPNLNDALLSVYKLDAFASFWYREPHIFNFSPETLRSVVERAGLSGEIKTIQRYNFINHLHWITTGEPQASAEIGMGTPSMVEDTSHIAGLSRDLQEWARRADQEYRQILNRHLLGDSIVFVGNIGNPQSQHVQLN